MWARRNSSQRDFSTGLKSPPSTWMECCTKEHSCWRVLCRNTYAACDCFCATPTNVLNPITHSLTFLTTHYNCGMTSPMYTPKYLLPVAMARPRLRKNLSTCAMLCVETTKILLVGYRKYPLEGPCDMMTSRWLRIHGKVPPGPTKSAYKVFINFGCQCLII